MELGGFGKLHAPFFTERRTRGPSTAAWQEIRLPAGLMFSGRPYRPGSDLQFIAGYRTDSHELPDTPFLFLQSSTTLVPIPLRLVTSRLRSRLQSSYEASCAALVFLVETFVVRHAACLQRV